MRNRRGSVMVLVVAAILLLGLFAFGFEYQAQASVRAARRAQLGQDTEDAALAQIDAAVADWLQKARPEITGGRGRRELEARVRELAPGNALRMRHEIDATKTPEAAGMTVRAVESSFQWVGEFESADGARVRTLTRGQVADLRAKWREVFLAPG